MNASRRKILIVAVLALLCSAAGILLVARDKQPEKALLKIMSDRVDLQVRNVRYTEVGDSGMKWEIMADTARYQKKENQAFFDRLTVRLITQDGKTYVMTGDRGRFNTESRDLELEGHVGVETQQGDRFTADRLRYRNADKVVDTDGPVMMANGKVRVSGTGMVLSLNRGTVAILSQVRATLGGSGREKP